MRFPHGPGFGMFGGILEQVIAGLFFIICFIVVVGLLFILVRFLLVATKAAELYVANHRPAEPVTPATTTPVATAPVTTTPAATAPVATKPAPIPRTRSTKPPTA